VAEFWNPTGTTGHEPGGDERSLACLIVRSAELKRALVVNAVDRFAPLYGLPNFKTVLTSSWPDGRI